MDVPLTEPGLGNPIRAELFSPDRLEEHAEALAAAQQVTFRPMRDRRLIARMADNNRALRAAYKQVSALVREDRLASPAADWLIDNFHVVEEQIKAIQTDLPPSFHRQLPKLTNGELAGHPRVLGIAWAYVSHTDSHFDPETLTRFVRAYQHVAVLTIGELWAVAIALRIVLVENLRRIADQILAAEAARREANRAADQIIGDAPEPAERVLDRPGEMHPAFVVRLIERLRGQDTRSAHAIAHLHQRLASQQLTAEQIVGDFQRLQGAANVTIRNIVTSMRLMTVVDWRELFESVSVIDARLRAGSRFAEYDFPTRDYYRRAIEMLARGARRSEVEVAGAALAAAGRARSASPDPDAHACDPGYYLVGAGRRGFERSLGYHVPMREWLKRANQSVGVAGYVGVLAVVTLAITALVVWSDATGLEDWGITLLALAALLPASDAATTLVNCGAAHRFDAIALPGLELAQGVPVPLRTMVVMPTLLTSRASIDEQVQRLEVHHLANDEGDFWFALLTDWTDSDVEHRPEDDALLAHAAAQVAALNARYEQRMGGRRFLLLHRRRLWNPRQGRWIGWERKRGKLHELNRLLRGATDTSFIGAAGEPAPSLLGGQVPAGVRYVVVLDADTRLPRGAAKRMVGKLAHPLNRALLDAHSRRVTEGYAILQPRVSASLPTGLDGSVFQRVFSNARGIDPYACAVSDVYQDLFGEGSYCGKGIYDLDMFEQALAGRVPENSLLSHDLLEGIFARAGLASDIEVVDDFPARYDVAVGRQHRWVRGDWQLLPWILGTRKVENAPPEAARIPAVGRWKMLDNLRRSLSAPAAFFALAVGWALPMVASLWWTDFVVVCLAIPSLLPLLAVLAPRRPRIPLIQQLREIADTARLSAAQILMLVAFLPHQAWVMSDAILRTLFRLAVSRRCLLEWVSAAQAKEGPRLDIAGFYRKMAVGVLLALLVLWLVAAVRPEALPIALPFVLLWIAAPALAQWSSRPSVSDAEPPLSERDANYLRLAGRRTWRFFETFVTAREHFLPPDNFQEDPMPVVAHRTSPTNMGLYLLSTIGARDFGWIGLEDTIERLEATLGSMDALERAQGHFYNWYGTLDLRPLEPKYISAVDSGNLAGHLVALWNALAELAQGPVLAANWRQGVADNVELARRSLRHLPHAAETAAEKSLNQAIEHLQARLTEPAQSPDTIAGLLGRLGEDAARISAFARTVADQRGQHWAAAEACAWAANTEAAIRSHQRDLELLVPWAGFALEWKSKLPALGTLPGLAELPAHVRAVLSERPPGHPEIAAAAPLNPDYKGRLGGALVESLTRAEQAATDMRVRIETLIAVARRLFDGMRFNIFFDKKAELMAIGLRETGELDANFYDLLASEARLSSFIAIAKGDLPTRHWFRLGRRLIPAGRGAALVSWSGSMFEYLMPSLVMRAPAGSLLAETNKQMLRQQMAYGARRGVPWGASESAYNARDLEFTYQYSSFGVPELALKRGLAEDTVIAPYATALAAMIDPRHAVANLAGLASMGGRGRYGWFEALDFTKARLPDDKQVAVVRCFMAHHQGMALVAIANALQMGRMRDRFHTEPLVQATELLLQERMPRAYSLLPAQQETVAEAAKTREPVVAAQRRIDTPHTAVPQTHLLSNGRYSVVVTAAGGGFSRRGGVAVTRWHEDVTRDNWGSFIYLRDLKNGELWSAGYQPTAAKPDKYEASFSEGRAEIIRQDGTLTTELEVVVSSEDDSEVRRVTITNRGYQMRDIEITSYAEIVLAPPGEDAAHPAFAKMFVQTEYAAKCGVLLATRRPREPGAPHLWAAHFLVAEGHAVGDLQFETDRARFIGRGRTLANPIVFDRGAGPLSGSTGTVLDPVFSLRRAVRLPPHSTIHLNFWTLLSDSRDHALDLADKHLTASAFERASTLAWTQAQVELRHLGLTTGDAHVIQRLTNRVIFSDPSLRPGAETLARGGGAASMLWALGISGDLPIVLLRIDQSGDMQLVHELLLAHEYWRLKQFPVDLVILNEQPSSYVQDFQLGLEAMARAAQRPGNDGARGSVFVLRADLIAIELRNLLQTAARAVLHGTRGVLAEQVRAALEVRRPYTPKRPTRPRTISFAPVEADGLEVFNGLGGFAEDGREYHIILGPGQTTPTPWANLICNPNFGFLCTAEGTGNSWSLDSQQNHLTPWTNDPVAAPVGEAFYVRDEESGELWTPTAQPIREPGGTYLARHGFGFSAFEYEAHGLKIELLQFVPLADPVKIARIRVQERAGRGRILSLTAYVEWVLGRTRSNNASQIVTEICPATGAMLARNPWSNDFGRRVAFADFCGLQTSHTGDRGEFLGRNGGPEAPAALVAGIPLSGRTGAGLDACTAMQARFELPRDGTVELVFLMGEAADAAAAQALIGTWREADIGEALSGVQSMWDESVRKVHVRTPERAMDLVLNGWLLYQALACRIWARAGFYQASGAFGFRDQLQDGMALCPSRPDLAREHLLRAAGRQFPEGDVQHWWLPESGRGIRTRISDDAVWLAYAVTHYVTVTGDSAVLDEQIPFLEGAKLREGEADAFFQPAASEQRASLFEHCARALDYSLPVGAHGLPLMGTGDWNDGMNRIGADGKGESVWLAWFLCATLNRFAPIAETRGDTTRADKWRTHAKEVTAAIEREAWDGAWYRRAYFDDGMPLGSKTDAECRIDAIAQSWGVISEAADPARAQQAMASVQQQLILKQDKLSLLFTPPFDQTPHDPGYIKAYPPGIRENGGQYTHAATWNVVALAMLGQGAAAEELFALLNPVNHSRTAEEVARYKVEPYIACADIYSVAPHVGRGGWTWYTGSAGWLHRAGMEFVLGIRFRAGKLEIAPCIPSSWKGFEATVQHGNARYSVSVESPNGGMSQVERIEVDGRIVQEIALADAGEHQVKVLMK